MELLSPEPGLILWTIINLLGLGWLVIALGLY
jgi:hypothetical protein